MILHTAQQNQAQAIAQTYTPVTSAKPTRNRQKPQNFQWIGQLSATDNVAEDIVKPVGVTSGENRYGIAQFETDK